MQTGLTAQLEFFSWKLTADASFQSTSTRGIRTEIGRRRLLQGCTLYLRSLNVRLQMCPLGTNIAYELAIEVKYSRAMTNPVE